MPNQIEVGRENRVRIRHWFATHLCGTARECGEALGISEMAVGRHVKAIRDEWARPRRDWLLVASAALKGEGDE